jgi:hypothetical protein
MREGICTFILLFLLFSFVGAISDRRQGATLNYDLGHFFRLCCVLSHLLTLSLYTYSEYMIFSYSAILI